MCEDEKEKLVDFNNKLDSCLCLFVCSYKETKTPYSIEKVLKRKKTVGHMLIHIQIIGNLEQLCMCPCTAWAAHIEKSS